MPTLHIHRLTLILPVARVTAFATWWAARVADGTLPYDDPAQWVPLNTSGSPDDPPTHRVSCGSYTEAQAKVLLGRLAAVSGLSIPADWDARPRSQKKQWLRDQRSAIRTAIGADVLGVDNDGDWGDLGEGKVGLRLKTIQPAKI